MTENRRLVAVPLLPKLRPSVARVATASPSNKDPNSDTATISTFTTKSTKSSNTPSKTEVRPSEDPERVRHEFDVYAKPFVPAALKDINNEHATVIFTATKHRIDFAAYSEEFGARIFLPPRPIHTVCRQRGDNITLTEASYFQYFSQLADAEYLAKEAEHATFSMYMVQLYAPVPGPDGHYLYSIPVPGLREDSPLIEVGDTIRLRQLWVDSKGNLMSVLDQARYPAQNHMLPRNWQGIEYHASVWFVNRAHEIIHLKIDGLVHATMVFNVQIPVKERYIEAQRLALHLVNHELHEIMVSDEQAVRNHRTSPQVNGANCVNHEMDIKLKTNDWLRRMLFPTEKDGVILSTLRSVANRGMFDPKLNYEYVTDDQHDLRHLLI